MGGQVIRHRELPTQRVKGMAGRVDPERFHRSGEPFVHWLSRQSNHAIRVPPKADLSRRSLGGPCQKVCVQLVSPSCQAVALAKAEALAKADLSRYSLGEGGLWPINSPCSPWLRGESVLDCLDDIRRGSAGVNPGADCHRLPQNHGVNHPGFVLTTGRSSVLLCRGMSWRYRRAQAATRRRCSGSSISDRWLYPWQ
jgi:hypothetical protein